MEGFQVYRQVDGKFKSNPSVNARKYLGASPQQGVEVVFADWSLFEEDSDLRHLMCAKWAYPAMMWEQFCHKANGFAGSAREVHGDGKTVVDSSWFQLLIKQLGDTPVNVSKHTYTWYEMSFYVYTLSSGAAVLFCFDAPVIFQNNLLKALNESAGASGRRPSYQDQAFLQCIVIQEVSRLYDTSVWTLRDYIRDIEKVRSAASYDDADLNFAGLHDLARHIIHTCEILAAAVDTITELMGKYDPLSGSPCQCALKAGSGPDESSRLKPRCPHNEMSVLLSMLRNFGGRANSLKERLSNEINLGFNVVVQRDSRETVAMSRATVDISRLAQSDSASMKTISVVTLAFLPATFVSTVFSMSFFTFNIDDETHRRWEVSETFWIYWVISVPLTALTLACWRYGQGPGQRKDGSDGASEKRPSC